jgi:hypothetical protein
MIPGLLGCIPTTQLNPESNSEIASTAIRPDSTITITPTPTETPGLSRIAMDTPASTGSSTPTRTDTPTITAIPTETAIPTDLPRRVMLSPMNHQWQTLNNCHRASIATIMGYYDVWFGQHDYDVAMDNLQEFLAPYGLTARIYSIHYAVVPMHDVVRWLLAENIPAIVGQNLSRGDNTWHYRVVRGYDDASREIVSDDPLLGPGLHHAYEVFDQLSRTSGQVIPVYPLEMDEMIDTTMRRWQMKLITYP